MLTFLQPDSFRPGLLTQFFSRDLSSKAGENFGFCEVLGHLIELEICATVLNYSQNKNKMEVENATFHFRKAGLGQLNTKLAQESSCNINRRKGVGRSCTGTHAWGGKKIGFWLQLALMRKKTGSKTGSTPP